MLDRGLTRLPRSSSQCHPPLFTDLGLQSHIHTWLQRAQEEKGALVTLPAHPREPGQAWQHHPFRVSLGTLPKCTILVTGCRHQEARPDCWGLSQAQSLCHSEAEARKGQAGQWGAGEEAPPCPGQRRSPWGGPRWMQWGCTCATSWSSQGQNQPVPAAWETQVSLLLPDPEVARNREVEGNGR